MIKTIMSVRSKWFLKRGLVYKDTGKSDYGGFDLDKFLKQEFEKFNVAYNDNCCKSAIDSTATASVADVESGVITSTSAAATSITLPDAEDFNKVQGLSKEFVVDNSQGTHTVTVVVGTGITAYGALTGSTTLTVASGKVAKFFLYFTSATTAQLTRLV